jgi:polyisoprenoid-binding protein YceI
MSTVGTPNPASGAFAAAAGAWTLDPAATTITFQTKAMWGLAKVKGSFKAVEGGGTVTETGTVQGSLTIDASSVDTGNKKRDDHLRSADFFESVKYPTFVFTATKASQLRADKLTISGTLTIRGQARPLDIEATVDQTSPNSSTLTTELELDRREWGITWAKMGAKVLNQMTIHARFTRS